MFDANTNIRPVFFEDLDAVFDEKGSTFISMRKTQWVKDGAEPDVNKAKLELRKWRVTDEGEKADKGFSFLTEQGPHELAKVLVSHGFGSTKDILLELKKRDDFKDAVDHMYDDEETSSDGEFFDMRTALLADDGEEEVAESE